MNEVSSIGKFLEPLSEAYAHIPFEGYGIAGILSIVLLAFYGIVISRLKITERRKILVRRVCAWCGGDAESVYADRTDGIVGRNV